MLDDAFELFIVTVLLGVAALYMAYQWRTGLLLSVVNLLPSVLVLLLAELGDWPPIVALMACVFALPIVGCFVDLVERHGISTSAHLVIADASMATMGICCIVPAFVAWTRLSDPLISGVLFVLGVGGVILAYEAHKLANRCRQLRWARTHRVQVRLLALFLITALAAMLIVFPRVVGTTVWFMGAAVYWGGCGLLSAKRDYQLRRDRREDAVRQLTGASRVMMGLSFMLLGIASVAAVAL
jgi:hypothetical protein